MSKWDLRVVICAAIVGALGCSTKAPESGAQLGSVQQALTVRTVSLRYPAGSAGDVPLVALNGSIAVGDRVKVLTTDGAAAGAVQLGTGTVDCGVNSRLGSVTSEATIQLRDRARIEGDAKSGHDVVLGTDALVTGTTQRNALVLPANTESFSTTLVANAARPVKLEVDQVQTIAPGAYGELALKSGSKLTLGAGDYAFTSGMLEPQSVLKLDDAAGAVRLFVDASFTFRGSVVSTTGEPPTLLVVQFGSTPVVLDASFKGTVMAPNAAIVLGPGAQPHEGAFFGKSLEVRPDTQLKYRPYFKLKPVPRFALPSPSTAPFGNGSFDAQGGFLAPAANAVVAVTSSGVVSTVFSQSSPGRFPIDGSAAFFGNYTSSSFELRARAGNLLATVALEPAGFGNIVPGKGLVYVPEVGTDPEKPRSTFARFFDNSGQRARFATPGLLVSRLTSSHLVYATRSELVRVTHAGVETWRKPIALRTFELNAAGTRLIGVLNVDGRSEVVNVDLATGAVNSSTVLAESFWNAAVSPAGRYSVATTKNRVYLFDGGALVRNLVLPVRWAVSVDVSDAGYVAVGGQSADHVGQLVLVGPPGTAISSLSRSAEQLAYRPAAQFFPDGARLLLNETTGLAAFDIQRAR